MTLFAATPTQLAAGQIALAVLLVAAGFVLLLPRPRGRSVAAGTAALVAAAAVFAAWLHSAFGDPMADDIGSVLFWLFAAGAVGFGAVLVVQRNPARGAIAFAFVILSTCGLFLLLAAPFLMAATIIIYAGAIIVTFLFVLMLSQAAGPSDENDRSREPLLGSLAGFAFVGLVLFTIYQTQQSTVAAAPGSTEPKATAPLPAPVLTTGERKLLADIAEKLRQAEEKFHGDLTTGRVELNEFLTGIEQSLEDLTGVSPDRQEGTSRDGSIVARLKRLTPTPDPAAEFYRTDPQSRNFVKQVGELRDLNYRTFEGRDGVFNNISSSKPDVAAAKQQLRKLREQVLLLQGAGELPARNVATLGLVLYADHLLAVELAGTLLLVATIGAVAIAHRRPA